MISEWYDNEHCCRDCRKKIIKKSYEKNKGKTITKKDHSKSVSCKICNGYYSDMTNFNHHNKTQKHKNALKQMNNVIFEYLEDLYTRASLSF